jgi:hypothetical protein
VPPSVILGLVLLRPIRIVALLVLATAAACQIERRSDAYRCAVPSDCDDGRTCLGGWCVSGTDPVDGGLPDGSADGGACPAPCTSCSGDVCTVTCAELLSCGGPIVCPAGMSCQVECLGDRSCQGGVDCSAASACTVTCGASRACGGPIVCGDGPCSVGCVSDRTCSGGVDCTGSCRCDVACTGPMSCEGDGLFLCPTGGACDLGTGCTSTPAGCNTCP